tara:strand:- start:1007 stop:1753 length:747 start_codon:yes stop_codon:yes gene_type:complete
MMTSDKFPEIAVISLARTPERLNKFRERFGESHHSIRWFPGIDGASLSIAELVYRGLIEPSAASWPIGQLGCAISHLRCHIHCLQTGRDMVIFEDDAIPAQNWQSILSSMLRSVPADWDLLLLGWNLDSALQVELSKGITSTSLFKPPYPDAKMIENVLGSVDERLWLRMQKGLGLAGYVISPRGAARLLEWAWPLRTMSIDFNDLPARICFSLDGELTNLYPSINAWVCFPPLVLALNSKSSSLTAV